jgi:hypothetical protein
MHTDEIDEGQIVGRELVISPAAPFSGDGRTSVVTLVWEKVQ